MWEVLVTEIIRRYGIIDKIVLESVNLQRYCEEPNMKCHACGRELNKDVKHCMYCGTPVPSGKEQASLKPIVNLKEQGLLQPDSRRPFPRWIPAALSGVLLLCLTLYWIIPKANSSTGSNTYPEPSAEAAAEEPAAAGSVTASDEEIYIPDPVLKKAIQDELGIGDREILASDAERLERLQHIVEDYEEKISDLTGISAFQNLNTIVLYNDQITDLTPLAGLNQLTDLNLSHNQIIDLTPLAGLTQITKLNLCHNHITDLTPLAGLTQMTYLHLNDNYKITDLTPLAGMTQMTELNLYHNKITDLTPLAGLNQLTYLHLNGNKIADLTPLADLNQLTYLHLDDNKITDLTPLTGMIQMTELNLKRNQITDLTPLTGMTQMTKLILESNKITDLTPLTGMTRLTQLNIVDNKITDYTPLDSLPDDCEIWR